MGHMLLLHAYIYIYISTSMQSRYACTFTACDRYRLHPRTWTIFPSDAYYPKKQITYSRLIGEAIVHAGSLASVIDDSVFPAVSHDSVRSLRPISLRNIPRSERGRIVSIVTDRQRKVYRKRDYVKLRDTRDTIFSLA